MATDLYIDELYVDSELTTSGTYANDIGTGSGKLNSMNTTQGYKWIVQITNPTTSAITLSDYRLNICTNYLNENIEPGDDDNAISLGGLDGDNNEYTIDACSSIYVGFTGLSGIDTTINNDINETISDTSNILLLSDQFVDITFNNVTRTYLGVTTRFYLSKVNPSGGAGYITVDNFGSSDYFTSGVYYNTYDSSVVLSALMNQTIEQTSGTWENNANSGADDPTNPNNYSSGSIRRKPNLSTVPDATYNESDWRYSSNVEYNGQIYFNNNLSEAGYCNSAATASASGDPHIITLDGRHYDFNHIGYLRYFDNCDNKNRLFINVKCEKGPGRWKKNDYLTKVFISYKDKNCTIDTGFRGKLVKIIGNKGFTINNEKLGFNKEALRYAFRTNFRSRNNKLIKEYLKNNPNDIVPRFLRNKITIKINDNFNLEIMNVNQYNLQPCRIVLKQIKKYNFEKCKGIIIHKKWALPSIIKGLFDDSLLKNRKKKIKEPEWSLFEPKDLNKQWY